MLRLTEDLIDKAESLTADEIIARLATYMRNNEPLFIKKHSLPLFNLYEVILQEPLSVPESEDLSLLTRLNLKIKQSFKKVVNEDDIDAPADVLYLRKFYMIILLNWPISGIQFHAVSRLDLSRDYSIPTLCPVLELFHHSKLIQVNGRSSYTDECLGLDEEEEQIGKSTNNEEAAERFSNYLNMVRPVWDIISSSDYFQRELEILFEFMYWSNDDDLSISNSSSITRSSGNDPNDFTVEINYNNDGLERHPQIARNLKIVEDTLRATGAKVVNKCNKPEDFYKVDLTSSILAITDDVESLGIDDAKYKAEEEEENMKSLFGATSCLIDDRCNKLILRPFEEYSYERGNQQGNGATYLYIFDETELKAVFDSLIIEPCINIINSLLGESVIRCYKGDEFMNDEFDLDEESQSINNHADFIISLHENDALFFISVGNELDYDFGLSTLNSKGDWNVLSSASYSIFLKCLKNMTIYNTQFAIISDLFNGYIIELVNPSILKSSNEFSDLRPDELSKLITVKKIQLNSCGSNSTKGEYGMNLRLGFLCLLIKTIQVSLGDELFDDREEDDDARSEVTDDSIERFCSFMTRGKK